MPYHENKNPYLRTGNSRYRPPKQKLRKRGFRFTPVNLSLISLCVVGLAIAGIAIANGGSPAQTATAAPTPTPATVIMMPPDATAVLPTPSPTPTQNHTAAPQSSGSPGALGSAAPLESPASGYFTSGGVQVDYDNMVYKSPNLYVKVTNVHENGVNYYVADCRAKDGNRLFTALANDEYKVHTEELTSVMAKRKGAVIAINGDYFGASAADRADRGVVIRNGKLYRKTPWYDIAAVYKDGTMKTYAKTDITADELMANNCWQAWNFGPVLMDGSGKALSTDKIKARPPKYNPANPRCGIGYIEPNHFVFVVVDGIRGETNKDLSKGMTTSEFAKLFESLGCKTAYNLDGGGSATMVFMGKVINHPCDNGGEERSVSDIVYFGESETDQANVEKIKNR